MTTTEVRFAGFADASPAKLREVIVEEDREAFDQRYREALDDAAVTLTLGKLEAFLVHWRRVAWSQDNMGHERWRAMLAKAEYITHTGQVPPGTVTYSEEEMADLIQAKLADVR
ncbi:MAG: DUF6247 family protein [Pseudonocardiaceae bacterium]